MPIEVTEWQVVTHEKGSTSVALIKYMCLKEMYKREEFDWSLSQDSAEVMETNFCLIAHSAYVRFPFCQN